MYVNLFLFDLLQKYIHHCRKKENIYINLLSSEIIPHKKRKMSQRIEFNILQKMFPDNLIDNRHVS